jgi:hypothetical protein
MSRVALIFDTICLAVGLFVASWVRIYSGPPCGTVLPDGRREIRIYVLQRVPAGSASQRVQQDLARITAALPDVVTTIIPTAFQPASCDLLVTLSDEYLISGMSGMLTNGCPVTVINPFLADSQTVEDELAHQLRGHVSVPHLPDPLFFMNLLMNVYMDETNVAWWWGVKHKILKI